MSQCESIAGSNPQRSIPGGGAGSGLRVLIIDDDRELCWLVREYLEPLGYTIVAAHTGPEGMERALTESFNAIVLDVMLPGMDGFEVLKGIRRQSDVPILMLTARGEESDRIVGLEFGADDYLPKTFSTRELLARLRAVTRRTNRVASPTAKGSEPEIVVGSLRIYPDMRRVVQDDKPVDLTALEFNLLVCLARSRGRVKTREQLIDDIAGRDYDVFDRSIDVHIWSLRKKLGDDPKNPRFIRTYRAVGYMLINPDAA